MSEDRFDREFDVKHAKDECSKNQRCVGIEGRQSNSQLDSFFNLCLDSIYISTAFDKYTNTHTYVYKKLENHGKFIQQLPLAL